MKNLDTRIRETLDRVAETTKVNRRADEIVRPTRRRRLPRFTVAIAAFAIVAAVFALPMMLNGSPRRDVAGGGVPAPEEAAVTPTAVHTTRTLPAIDGASAIAAQLGGSALGVEKLKLITGMEAEMAFSGYLIDSTITSDGSYELGLIVYESEHPGQNPVTCFTNYAVSIDEGVNVAGGTHCGSDTEGTQEIASFDVSIGGSCGGIPKEEPVVDGVWTLLTVWGIPKSTDTARVQLSDGSTAEIAVREGVAHQLWESGVGIEAIEFDGMNDQQRNRTARYLPASGIDC